MKIYENYSIANFSYIHVGGLVKNIIIVENELEMINALKKYKKAYIFGNTSKTLFAFEHLEKNIILDRNDYILDLKNKIQVGSGTLLSKVGNYFLKNNYKGFSYIYTIPGRVGGSLVQNASYLNQAISSYLISVTFLEDNKIKTLKKESLLFSYRSSYFKFHKCVILHCEFKKELGIKTILKKEYEEALQKRSLQPKELSLGSIFKNKNNYFVGKILDDYKGFYLSKSVKVSNIHANFLNIKKDCFYNDILLLINTLFIVLYKRTKKIFPLEIIILKG